MLFHEVYGAYYQTVAKILTEAVKRSLNSNDISKIIEDTAFEESKTGEKSIENSMGAERWRLLKSDGRTILKHAPTMPLTSLQRSWINAIAHDPRIRLFTDDPITFPDVEPLFLPEDICVFDKYADGDPYEDENYIKSFRLILDAIKNQYPLQVTMTSSQGELTLVKVLPEYMEYSEKDDKFRVIGDGEDRRYTINLGRIISCERCEDINKVESEAKEGSVGESYVTIELTNVRNTLNRAMLHFAHFKKEAKQLDEMRYRIKVYYDKGDESEILIRILSFGPTIRVVEPVEVIDLIKKKLSEQKGCGL